MKKNSLKVLKGTCVFLLNNVLMTTVVYAQTSQTFLYTGAMQTFTVPACVTSVTIIASGAQGVGVNNQVPGNGGRARGSLTVTGGQVLNIFVGGSQSGYNGGGPGQNGANGGGASDVRLGGITLNDRIIVAGGGGGAGGDNWGCTSGTGHGGGAAATATNANFVAGAGGAGYATGSGCGTNADTLGGLGGSGLHGGGGGGGGFISGGAGASSSVGAAGSGSLGLGGAAFISSMSCVFNGTGGGGGGYYGGGGAAGNDCGAGRGGGGSSWTGTLSSPSFTAGAQTGNGSVVLIYDAGTNVTASATATSICTGTNPTLTANGMVTYTWIAGSGSPSVISNASAVSVSPTVTTSYSVSGTNSLGCVSNAVVAITVYTAVPSLSLTASTNTVCDGKPATFTVSGASTYTWSTTSNNSVITITPVYTTTYTVAGRNSCGISQSLTLTVNPTPTVTAVASTGTVSATTISLCSGSPATLSASGANTYTWTGGVINNSAFFPQLSTFYVVTGANIEGCTSTAMVSVTVVYTPTLAPVSTASLICAGAFATLSASGATGYTWMPGGSTNPSIVVSPVANSTYTLTKANLSCTYIHTISLDVNPLPAVAAGVSPTLLCLGSNAVLTGSGALTYTWMPGNLTGSNVTINPAANTIYTLTASDGTCASVVSVPLSTTSSPTVTATTSSLIICRGETTTLTASGATSYLWLPGNYSVATITVSPTVTTTYSVTGTTGICSSAANQSIQVNPNPTLTTVAIKPLICAGGTSSLFVAGANTYSWSTGALSSSVSVSPNVTSIYTVTGFYTSGCNSTTTIPVSIFVPTVTISGPTVVCMGTTVNLVAGGASSYTWNTGSQSATLPVSPVINTSYTVSATSSSNNVSCTGSNTIGLLVNPSPTITAWVSDPEICKGEVTTLMAGGASSYTWIAQAMGASVQVSPLLQTSYTVQGTDANGCLDTAVVVVKVDLCSGISEVIKRENDGIIVYPNPNNGEFMIQTETDIHLNLVNDLGQLINRLSFTQFNDHRQRLHLAAGVYYITGHHSAGSLSRKIVVTD